MRRFALLLFFALPACAPLPPTPRASGNQTDQTIELPDARRMRYLLYRPDEYVQARDAWPLILFLHGGGEAGEKLGMVRREGLPRLLEHRRRLPFVVVSPLSPRKAWSIPDLLLFLDGVERTHRVDRARVYVTGLSTGALAAWKLAAAAPDRIAAIAPITLHRVPEGLCGMKSVPVWAFHNARDMRAPIRVMRKAVEILRACGGDVRLTVYPEEGHDAWSRTYNRSDLYEWLLQHRREMPPPGGQESQPRPPRSVRGRWFGLGYRPVLGRSAPNFGEEIRGRHGQKPVMPPRVAEGSSDRSRAGSAFPVHQRDSSARSLASSRAAVARPRPRRDDRISGR